jgi:hypothetical protein
MPIFELAIPQASTGIAIEPDRQHIIEIEIDEFQKYGMN